MKIHFWKLIIIQSRPAEQISGNGIIFKRRDSIGKPSSVAYDHLSRRNVAITLKPPFNGVRRADALSPAPIGVASDRVYMASQSPAIR